MINEKLIKGLIWIVSLSAVLLIGLNINDYNPDESKLTELATILFGIIIAAYTVIVGLLGLLKIENKKKDETRENSTGNIYNDIKRRDDNISKLKKKREGICKEFAKLNKKREDIYKELANELVSQGNLQRENYPNSAAESYKEALQIYKELVVQNRNAYLPKVATTLNNLVVLQKDQLDYCAAETSYQEILNIYKELAAKKPGVFRLDFAMTLVNISLFYQEYERNKKLSIKYAGEAIKELRECIDTPAAQKQLEKAKQVIEAWNQK